MDRWIDFLLGVALVIVIVINFILKDVPNYFYFDEEIKVLITSVAFSYIAAYIFYLVQVRIPKNKQREKLRLRLSIPLSLMLKEMQSLLIPYLENDDFIEFKASLKSTEQLEGINLFENDVDLVSITGPNQTSTSNHFEYIRHSLNKIEQQIDRINQLNKIDASDTDFILICDEIKYSSMHFFLNSLIQVAQFQAATIVPAVYIEDELKKYLNWCIQIRQYMLDNKIPFSVSTL